MGSFDFQTVLGNRDGHQSGHNFDNCKKKDRSPDERMKYKLNQFNDRRFDYESVGVDLEGQLLIMEVLRIPIKTNFEYPKGHEDGLRGKPLRDYEKEFMRKVYPLASDVKLYATATDCDEWEFCVLSRNKRYERLPKKFNYLDYAFKCGTFKCDKYDDDDDDEDFRKCVHPSLIFTNPPFEKNKEEIWIRVWYKQVWKGFIEENQFNPYTISDQLILWTIFELGIQKKYREDITRGEAWKICKEKIQKRYFNSNPIQSLLLVARKNDGKCLFHEDEFPLDMFKIIWSCSFLKYPKPPERTYPKEKKKKQRLPSSDSFLTLVSFFDHVNEELKNKSAIKKTKTEKE